MQLNQDGDEACIIVEPSQRPKRTLPPEPEFRLRNHKLSLTSVCVDSKDRYAFTASKDGSIIKWNLKTGKISTKINSISKREYEEKQSLQQKHHTKHINSLAISSDDKFLASGGWDKQIRIWLPEDLSWIHTFTLHKQEITALAFRRGHPTLYSASADRSVALWSLEDDDNRCYVESLYGHESAITSMDSLRKERILTSGGRDQSIRIWKIVEQAQTVFESKHESVDIARYIDDSTFVTGGEDGKISIWTTMKRKPVYSQEKAHQAVENEADICTQDSKGRGGWISALATYSLKLQKHTKPTKKRRLNDEDAFDNQYDEEEERGSGEDSNEEDPEENIANNVLALVASGSCDSKINIWKVIKSGSTYELKLNQSIDCSGFVNDLKFTSNGKKLIAACGQEHKYGRWWKIKGSRNCMRLFDVK